MKEAVWQIVCGAAVFCGIGAGFVIGWFYRRKNRQQVPAACQQSGSGRALAGWRLLAVLWPLLCLAFVAIILCQPGWTVDERIAGVMFALFPLVFFAVGMAIRRRLLQERREATVSTVALVVSTGRRSQVGKRSFFPEYQFQANGQLYRVASRVGYGTCPLKEGAQVELFYAPENPRVFYVPAMQKRDRRLSALFCGIGLVFPLLGLFLHPLQAVVRFFPQ